MKLQNEHGPQVVITVALVVSFFRSLMQEPKSEKVLTSYTPTHARRLEGPAFGLELNKNRSLN